MSRNCVTHHQACDCREAKVAKVVRAAERLVEYADYRGNKEIVGPGKFAWGRFIEEMREAIRDYHGRPETSLHKEGN